MRTLDSLIWDVAFGAADGGQRTVLICHDPTLDLTRAAVAAGAPVVFCDSDYTRSQQARSFGAEVAGDVRLDEYLAGASGSAVAVGEMPKSLACLLYTSPSPRD